MIWICTIKVLIRRREFEQYGERQSSEYSRDSEVGTYYTPFLPKFKL